MKPISCMAALSLLVAALPATSSAFNVVFDTLPVVGENSLLSWSNVQDEANTIFTATSGTDPENPFGNQSGSLYIANSTGSATSTLTYRMFDEPVAKGNLSVTFNLANDGFNIQLGNIPEGDRSIGSATVLIRFLADTSISVDTGSSNVTAQGVSTPEGENLTATVEWDRTAQEEGFLLKINGTYANINGTPQLFAFRNSNPINSLQLSTRSGGSRQSKYFLGSVKAMVTPEPSTVSLLTGLAALGIIIAARRIVRC